MKILYATMQLGRGYGQGTERYVALLAAGARSRGHDAVCIAGDPERRGPRVPLGQCVDGDPHLLSLPTRSWMSVRGCAPRRLRPLLAELRPDLLHVANPAHIGIGLLRAARELGIPVVATVMDFWWICPKHTLQHPQRGICDGRVTWMECLRCLGQSHARGWPRRIAQTPGVRAVALPLLFFGRAALAGVGPGEWRRWIGRQRYLADALSAAQAVIFPSQTSRRLIGGRIAGPQQVSIPYGIEPRWFAARPLRAAALAERKPGDAPVIGYAGALADHKGVHLLLQAIRRLDWRDVHVRIAGGGDAAYEARLRALAAGYRFEFVGRVATEAMPRFLSQLDVLVAPSTWPENLPIAVLEAQAVGVPVLASRVEGIAEMIPSAEQLFDIGSAESLAQRLAAWRSGRVSFAAAAVSTTDEMLERTFAVYTALRGG